MALNGTPQHLRNNAKALRQSMTDAEKKLWSKLRAHRVLDLHFRRQAPIGPFIVDFLCQSLRLVIELDGGQHGQPDGEARDASRDKWLRGNGYHVLRFWNSQIFSEFDTVLAVIHRHCSDMLTTNPSPPPCPPPQAGEGIANPRHERS